MRYLTIYRTNMVLPAEDLYIINENNFRLYFKVGAFEFSFPVLVKKFKPPGAMATMNVKNVKLPSDCYLVIELEVDERDIQTGKKYASLQVAETICLFDLQCPYIIDEKIYEGFISTGYSLIWDPDSPTELTAQPIQDPKILAEDIAVYISSLSQLSYDNRNRYRLAARWFRRGYEAANPIDKILFWWTVLEIYPAQGSTNIPKYTCELLVKNVYPTLNRSDLKSKIKLGRICGLRGDIIHNGKAFVEADEKEQIFDYIERLKSTDIDIVCLRILVGLPPGRDLDKYAKKK